MYITYLIVSCRFSTANLVQSLIMVQALEEINQKQELGNLTLGYLILDSCGDVTTSLRKIPSFMRGNCEYSEGEKSEKYENSLASWFD